MRWPNAYTHAFDLPKDAGEMEDMGKAISSVMSAKHIEGFFNRLSAQPMRSLSSTS